MLTRDKNVVLNYFPIFYNSILGQAWVRTSGVEWPSVILEREMRQHEMTVVKQHYTL